MQAHTFVFVFQKPIRFLTEGSTTDGAQSPYAVFANEADAEIALLLVGRHRPML